MTIFINTRSYAALRAADLDWIIGPGYSSGGYILGENHEKLTFMTQNEKVMIKTIHAGSQLTSEMGEGVGQE